MLFKDAAFWVGFVGDIFLQLTDNPSYHLTGYFQRHGKFESVCIAGGMMYALASLFTLFARPTLVSSALYGAGLDELFRTTRIFPSLDGYYQIPRPWTLLWGAIPMMLAFLVSS